jgi:Ca-activated chloride channel homolog
MNRRLAIRNLMAAGAGSFLERVWARHPDSQSPDNPAPSNQPKDTKGDFILHSQVRLVLLDVSVKDGKGSSVSGLSKESFHVFENGQTQHIKVFANDDVPVTVGILVDESRSMTPKRSEVLAAAGIFIEESNPRDEVFILHFNDRVTRGLPPGMLFSDDLPQLQTALHRGIPEGKTALNDAVVAGLEQLELGRRDKKTLVVISDGGDNASTHDRRGMLNAVERSIATIYSIGLFDPDDPDRDPGILRHLASITGGEAYLPSDPSQMAPVCRRIAKDIRTRYTIGYAPPTGIPNGPGKKPLRHIQVRASAPGLGSLVVRTRTSYRYDDTESQRTQ